jgi:hypothetical protein
MCLFNAQFLGGYKISDIKIDAAFDNIKDVEKVIPRHLGKTELHKNIPSQPSKNRSKSKNGKNFRWRG